MEKPIQYLIISECWLCMRKYLDIKQNDDDRWDSLLKDMEIICNKYGRSKFVKAIFMACLEELERLSKEGN